MFSTGVRHEMLEVGVISPEPMPSKGLGVGEVGYLITGVKDVRQSRVGDTVTTYNNPTKTALAGYKDPKPMVFSGLFPLDGADFPVLREALDKLQLNDAALVYEPESSAALGFGFRCGFLGLLHMEIVRERLERESKLNLISTAPNVVYNVKMEDGRDVRVTNPSEFPDGKVAAVFEPIVRSTILAPSEFIGVSWNSAKIVAAYCSAWITSPKIALKFATHFHLLKSSSTSLINSRAVHAVMHHLIMKSLAMKKAISLRSISCCKVRQ
jgi:GTP-binding protein LepA